MSEITKLILEMISFDAGAPDQIAHFIKVHNYARIIGLAEGLDEKTQLILEAAAVVHDIAIVPCEAKYGYCTARIQEQEGPDMALSMLDRLGFAPDVTQRVAALVGRHHTYEGIDGPDCQILIEADFLVNLHERHDSKDTVKKTLRTIFKTPVGTKICTELFGIS